MSDNKTHVPDKHYYFLVHIRSVSDRLLYVVITEQNGTVIDEYKTTLTHDKYTPAQLTLIADYFAKNYVWPTQDRIKSYQSEGYIPQFDAAASFLDDNFADRILSKELK